MDKSLQIIRILQNNSKRILKNGIYISMRNKHWDPKFKWLRSQKVIPVDLSRYEGKMTKEKFRTILKEAGIAPARFWKQRPITITSLTEIIDPYNPPDGDGKMSFLSKEGLESVVSNLKKKRENYSSISSIKNYDASFDIKLFPQQAHDIYVKAHTILMNKNPDELSEFVTERACMEMMEGLQYKTVKWKFIESLEAPLVVQTRCESAVKKNNLFAQITVRFHTKQCLAIYDRFGRLIFGSEIIAKDVLEYVVFEKHIVNEYGVWRMHAKIIPDWQDSSTLINRTYRVIEEKDDDNDDEIDELLKEDLNDEHDVEIIKDKSETQANVQQ